jgi:hypothetical protein
MGRIVVNVYVCVLNMIPTTTHPHQSTWMIITSISTITFQTNVKHFSLNLFLIHMFLESQFSEDFWFIRRNEMMRFVMLT